MVILDYYNYVPPESEYNYETKMKIKISGYPLSIIHVKSISKDRIFAESENLDIPL